MTQEAREQLRIPALGIKITAVVGAVLQFAWIGMLILGVGGEMVQGGEDAMPVLFGGGIQIAGSFLGILVGIFLWIGATRMEALRSYNLCLVAAILALIPCLSPCCLITLPFGVWALVMLIRPEVKEAFTA
jgi:hypothetical protein